MTARTPRAMILAAGFGTRLGELTNVRPKPMLPVCGTPLVRWSVLWLRSQGIREFVINLHHMGEQIEAELGDGSNLGVAIVYSREDEILGTGGGLRQARRWLDDGSEQPIVVVNGKILLELSLPDVLAFHARRHAEATMVLRPDPEAARWGSFRLDEGDRVAEFLGTTGRHEPKGPALMFTGVHVLQPRFLDRIPSEGPQCVIRTAYRSLFDEGSGPHGFISTEYWWEHSTTQRYLQGVWNVLDGHVSLPYAEHPLTGIHPDADLGPARVLGPVWIGPDVRVLGEATLGPYVQLGSGTIVEAGLELTRAIAWPGARVFRNLRDEVLP